MKTYLHFNIKTQPSLKLILREVAKRSAKAALKLSKHLPMKVALMLSRDLFFNHGGSLFNTDLVDIKAYASPELF